MKNKTRKLLSLLLALVLALSLSVTAFATDAGTITVKLEVQSKVDPTITKVYDVKINEGQSVEDAVKAANKKGLVSDWSGSWMTSITVDGNTYGSAPYVAPAEYFDDGIYEGGDPVLDAYDDMYGGVMLDGAEYFKHEGYYLMAEDNQAMYLGADWTFQIKHSSGDYFTPGEPDPNYPNNFREYTMGETVLSAGDSVKLTYAFAATFFSLT